MKKYSESELRILRDLDPVFLETRFSTINRQLAETYLNKFIVKSMISKKTQTVSELIFVQDQMDLMELEILSLRKELHRLKQR